MLYLAGENPMQKMKALYQPEDGEIMKVTRQRNCQIKERITRYSGCVRNIKKSHRHTGKMTEALFLETAECEEQRKEQDERRLNVSGVLKLLGVSRSGYHNWKKRLPSKREFKSKP